MQNSRWWRPTLWLAVNAALLCVLGFYQTGKAEPKENLPFANAVDQRYEMIQLLKEINSQLKEQNALLRSGKLQVVVESRK